MRLQVLTVALALGAGAWTAAQAPSSSSAQPQLPLPSSPRSPKSAAECDAYQKQIDDQMAQISQRHAACLDSFKADRQGDNDLICSRSECQSLHTLLYGPHKKAGEQEVASCRAAVERYQARSAAQQQGIQTLGNAISELLATTPTTPIDSQNDLASYEEQQNGQAVIGDDAGASASMDPSAQNIMQAGVQNDGIDADLQRQVEQRTPQSESGPSDQQLSLVDTALSLVQTSAQQIGEGFSNLKNSGAATAVMEFLSTKVEPTFSSAVTDIGGVFISLEKGLLDPDVAKGTKAIYDQANDPNKLLNGNERNQMCAIFPEDCKAPTPKK